jgi:hypothetical protein
MMHPKTCLDTDVSFMSMAALLNGVQADDLYRPSAVVLRG